MAVGFPAKTNFATGDVLTATNVNDITGTLNLLQSTLYPAGRNKIINGDFSINQRNLVSDAVGGYGFDRWQMAPSGGTATQTAQAFTLGTAPVAGYEGKNFLRMTTTVGNDFCRMTQGVESVRTFAGQTVILSFWAKGTNPSSPGYLAVNLQQIFGTGGSPSANVTLTDQNFVLTANWARYSFTFDLPSIAGKTLGTSGNDRVDVNIGQLGSTATNAWTLDLWGVQLEAASTGSTASPFQTASGSIGGELALCQRYYVRFNASTSGPYAVFAPSGITSSTTQSINYTNLPVELRTYPSSIEYGGTMVVMTTSTSQTVTSIALQDRSSNKIVSITYTVASGLTANQFSNVRAENSATAYLGISAEL